jgi:molybdate transport system ATP-binding protein
MKQASIIVSNITAKQFGKTVLNDISFTIHEQEQLAIVGSGGSGKTSLAKAIAGLLFTSGTVQFLRNNTTYKPVITYVSQLETLKNLSNVTDFYYQQRFNSTENEDSLTLFQELSRDNDNQHDITYWLDTFSLNHRTHSPLLQLSNGELKKMQLIKHLLKRPDVLILDNAFVGLDVQSREQLEQQLNSLAQKGLHIISICSEHQLPAYITHVAVLKEGQLQQLTTKNKFVPSQTKHQFSTENLPTLQPMKYEGAVIEMHNVSIRYGQIQILQQINWKVKSGECWALKGANGAGKSTLLSLVTADNPQAYSQNISLFGKRRGTGESIWDIKSKIGFVSPELHKYFDITTTAYNAIGSGFFDTMGLFRQLNAEQHKAVTAWLQYFNLTAIQHKSLSLLSASEQRLILIARALVKNPVLLVLDEPTQGLDDEQVARLVSLINTIHAKTKVSMVFTSHYATETPACVSHVIELKGGKAYSYRVTAEVKQHELIKEHIPTY